MLTLVPIGVRSRPCDTIIFSIRCVMNYEFAAYSSWFAKDMAVGSRNDKNSIARKRTYAETVANYITPCVAPQIAIATHV